MKKLLLSLSAAIVLAGCGGKIDPEQYQEQRTTEAATIDETVAGMAAWRSLSEYSRGDQLWDVKVGYVEGKPAMVKMIAADNRQTKWWIYIDTASGKVNFLKEETAGKDGKGVRNLFGYKDTALIFAKAGMEPYQPVNEMDFRMKADEVNKVFKEVVAAVEADRPDLSKAANDARRKNAQVFAAGNEPGWSLVINPSMKAIDFNTNYGEEKKSFPYMSPTEGPLGESIYDVRLNEDRLKITIASKYCVDDSGKVLPYSVVIVYNGKNLTGCGVPLQ